MLNKKELNDYKAQLNFNIYQLEKDYLQHLFLLFLSKNVKNELIFKGGTALQKVYGLNRFSEDLDFTINGEIDLDKIIKRTSESMTGFGFLTDYKEIESRAGKNYCLKIKGPLYDGTEKTIATLRIDASLRKDIILNPDLKEVIPVYSDIPPYLVLVMKNEEILAEKIRTILQREKSKDIYDVWFLLKKGAEIDFKLIEKKCSFFEIKFSKKEFMNKIASLKKKWDEELSGYVNLIPEFSEVIRDIKEFLKRGGEN